MLICLVCGLLIALNKVADSQTTDSGLTTISGVTITDKDVTHEDAVSTDMPRQPIQFDENAIDPELAKHVNENTINEQLEPKRGNPSHAEYSQRLINLLIKIQKKI